MGCFPARQLVDATIFAEMLRATFAEFPADLGLQAVERLKRAAYNRIYSRTTVDATRGSGAGAVVLFAIILAVVAFLILR
jgi:hypothetical protein